MASICGMDCCDVCAKREECGGCTQTEGHPLGGDCLAARIIKRDSFQAFMDFKARLIDEFNALGLEGLHIDDLNLLNGWYVNLPYHLDNGASIKLLRDDCVYFGNQVEIPGTERCYGLVADDRYLLVCSYGPGGADAEIVLYSKHKVA